ncbi:MAG: hypothetical protein HYV95_17730 [Opitutae bacterium]|nr:hypothetical protein [Opitutae bacterium]
MRSAGFSLTELIIAATLSGFVLAGVLSAFVFIGRSGFRTSSLSELENEARRGLEVFAEDARLASDIRWNNAQSITLTVPASAAASTQVTYAYDSSSAGVTAGSFYRLPGDADSAAPRRVLIHGLAPDFAFKRYKLEQPGVADNSAASDLETKQIQLVLRAQRTSVATAGVSQSVVSARYILRNKRVSN